MKETLQKLKESLSNLRNVLDTTRETDIYTYDDQVVPKDAYNYSEGMNAGAFTIKKPLENVTADDILNAYELRDLFEGVPIIYDTWENMAPEYKRADNPSKFIWAASGVKLIYADLDMMTNATLKQKQDCYEDTPSTVDSYVVSINSSDLSLMRSKVGKSAKATMKNIGTYNRMVLQELPSNCVGLKLDRVYPLYATGDFSSKTDCFFPKCDFIIDGEDEEGNVAGGFMFRYGGLSADHSLVLKKVHFMKRDSEYSGVAIFPQNGIDQVQIIDSLFDRIGSTSMKTDTREGHGYAGYYISLSFDDEYPLKENGEFKATNRIKHILIKGNTAYGYGFYCNSIKGKKGFPGRAFISDSHRFINNTIYGGDSEDNLFAGYTPGILVGFTGPLIGFGNDNNSSWKTSMGFYSCPMWLVGNRFYGADRVVAKKGDKGTYNCGVLTECGQVFMIKNTFESFLTKQTFSQKFSGEKEIKSRVSQATYDSYNNTTRVWWVNNIIKNVVFFSFIKANADGLFKSKGRGVPNAAIVDWNFEAIRYISGNQIILEEEKLYQKWQEATVGKYETDGKDAYYPYGEPGSSYYGKARKTGDHKPEEWRIEDLTRDGSVREASDHQDLQVGILKDYMPYLWGEKHYDRLFDEHFYDSVTITIPTDLAPGSTKATHNNPTPLYKYTFKNNIIDVGNCCIGGMSNVSHIYCVHFVCEGNKFKGRRFSSNLWAEHRNMVDENGTAYATKEHIFDVVSVDIYKCAFDDQTNMVIKNPEYAPTVTVRNNTFEMPDYVSNGVVIPTYIDFVRICYNWLSYIYSDLGSTAASRRSGKVTSERLKISNNVFKNPNPVNNIVCVQEPFSGATDSTATIYDGADGTKSSLTLTDIRYNFPSTELLNED